MKPTLLDIVAPTGWSQAELARRSGLAPPTISLLVNGRVKRGHVRTASALASVLETPAQRVRDAIGESYRQAHETAVRPSEV